MDKLELLEPIIILKFGSWEIYNVNFKDNMIINCTCPHCFYRKTVCKHMMYVSLNKDIDIKISHLKLNIMTVIKRAFQSFLFALNVLTYYINYFNKFLNP